MPPLAVGLGAAAIGIGGAALSASAQKKAANKAADTSMAVAEKNNALAENIYGQNKTLLSPYSARGNVAGEAYNALLGLPSAPMPGVSPVPITPQSQSMPTFDGPFGNIAQALYSKGIFGQPQPVQPVQPAPAQPAVTVDGAKNAFGNYLNSAGYQFRMDQGNKAINQGYAAKGSLQSGAALKALQGHGQNLATDYFKDYMALLANQQGVGLSGASAVAGVGQNYVNNITANNNSAGSAAANAFLAKGAANSEMYSGIGNSLGRLFGSSYGGF